MQENQELKDLDKKISHVLGRSNLFLVSSAIHVKHGVYSSEERLAQTIETCKSIKTKTGGDICILDGGYKDLDEEEKEKIEPYMDQFISFFDHPIVENLQEIKNHDIVKNMIEIFMFGTYYGNNKEKIPNFYRRIFKISGRYVLNDDFDLFFHINHPNKIVIRGPYTTQFNAQITGGVVLQYMSRLWSFDSQLVNHIYDVYCKASEHMAKRVNEGGYIDIEHLLYNYLDYKLIVTPTKIGIQGNIAPNGVGIME